MKSRKVKWIGLSLGLIYMALLVGEGWPARLLGQGGIAHACCYDPPAAVITPDPPAAPVPAAPAVPQNVATDDGQDSASNAPEEREDIPPFNPYDGPLEAARNAIADGEWLRARGIILEAEEVFGAEPVLLGLKAEIDAYFGLADTRAPAIAAAARPLSLPLQTLSSGADPLASMLDDFGVIASSEIAE